MMDRALPRWLFPALVLIAVAIVVVGLTAERPLPPMQTVLRPQHVVSEVRVSPNGAGMEGTIGQLLFRQLPRTTGVSRDALHFRFTEPVRVLGVLVSADIHNLPLVEFAVGVNQPIAYATGGSGWLFHVSDANNGPSEIDEHIWFPEPVLLDPSDYLSVGAWMYNADDVEWSVSPEIIVYFTSRPEA